MAKPLENMTVEELQAENHRLMQAKDEIRERQRELTRILDRRIVEEEARRRVEQMSDPERAALAQAITDVGGIESAEQVG